MACTGCTARGWLYGAAVCLLLNLLVHGALANTYFYEDSYMSDWNKDWALLSGRLHQPKCVDIPSNMSLCKNIGYSQMRLPNLLEHDTLREVTQQAASWVPLLNVRCHADTKLFLCSLFSPVCLDRPIWPCRSLCKSVQHSCEGIMNRYNFSWPEMLFCDKFPLDNDLCIGLQTDEPKDDKICEACSKPDTFEALIDNYCNADFAVRMKLDENVISEGKIKLIANKKKRLFKKGSLKKRDIRGLTVYIENGHQCECPYLDAWNQDSYLVMGHKRGDQLVVSFLQPFDKRNKEQRKALRATRKEDICQSGIRVLTGAEEGQEEDDDKKDRKRKNRRRRRKQRERINVDMGDMNNKRERKGKKNRGRRIHQRNRGE